jgi:hypothetical protein
MHAFDLVNETWSRVETRLRGGGAWPYPRGVLYQYGCATTAGKFYVFGGAHFTSAVGTTLFMCLDLATMEWERLSGTTDPLKADHAAPGPRRHPSMWVDEAQGRIIVMYGEANRLGARISEERHGAMHGYGCVAPHALRAG